MTASFAGIDRRSATVPITDDTWLEYDFDDSVTIVRSHVSGVQSVMLTANQAVCVISGISEWLVTFFDSKAARPAKHPVTHTLWLQNTDDFVAVHSSRAHNGTRKRVQIDLGPRTAAKTAAALAGWLRSRPSWGGKGML